jgi:RNA polymerase sigma factor (sigma-70 family)
MASEGSITHWFREASAGNSTAAEALWQRYYPELIRLARQRLRGIRSGIADEEDVVLNAMDSFFEAARQGRFPDLADRDDLWRLLHRMTARKVVDLKRRETRQRRGGGRVRRESDLRGADSAEPALADVIGDVPTPEFAAIMAEQCQRLLEGLSRPNLQAVAIAKMQGYTNREIAEQLECSVRTVERELVLIREKWKKEKPQ